MSPVETALIVAVVCVTLLGVWGIWWISLVNLRVMVHAKTVTEANLALSEKPSAAALAMAMVEEGKPQNGELQEVGMRPNQRRPWS